MSGLLQRVHIPRKAGKCHSFAIKLERVQLKCQLAGIEHFSCWCFVSFVAERFPPSCQFVEESGRPLTWQTRAAPGKERARQTAHRQVLRRYSEGRTSSEPWSWRRDLNPRPSDYKSDALPTELRQLTRLQPLLAWSGRRESNPQPTAWKAVTLPLSYSRSGRTIALSFYIFSRIADRVAQAFLPVLFFC